MKRSSLWLAVIVLFLVAGVGSRSWADEEANEKAHEKANDIPDKALCQTCSAHGAAHGEEEVVAWRLYDGTFYYFCSQQCGETFDGFPEAYVPRTVPRAAPQMVLTTVGGETVHIGKPTGEVLLLDFWATWCAPCKKELPALQELYREFGPRGLEFVAYSLDEDRDVLEQYIRDKGLRWRVAWSGKGWDDETVAAWAVNQLPAKWLIGRDGRIRAFNPAGDELRRAVAELLAEPAA